MLDLKTVEFSIYAPSNKMIGYHKRNSNYGQEFDTSPGKTEFDIYSNSKRVSDIDSSKLIFDARVKSIEKTPKVAFNFEGNSGNHFEKYSDADKSDSKHQIGYQESNDSEGSFGEGCNPTYAPDTNPKKCKKKRKKIVKYGYNLPTPNVMNK